MSTPAIKLLFYNHTDKVSGAEHVLKTLVSRLPSEEYSIAIVCPRGDMSAVADELKVRHVEIPILSARFTSNPLHLVKYMTSGLLTFLRFRKVLLVEQPDIVHANSVRAGLIAALASFGLQVPIVWHIHDMLPNNAISTLVRAVAFSSPRNKLVAVSKATAIAFRKSRPSTCVFVIYNGIDGDVYKQDASAGDQIRQEQKIAKSTFVACMVGQITRRKGQLGMVQSFAKVIQRVPGAVLLIVGAPVFTQDDHEYRREITDFIESRGLSKNVRLLGARRDVPALLNAADVVVVNSSREPFALVVIEALATGKPVVAPDIDGYPEVVCNNVTGFVTNPNDKEAMPKHLCRLAADTELRFKLGEQGMKVARTSFTAEMQARRFITFYRSVLEAQSSQIGAVVVEA